MPLLADEVLPKKPLRQWVLSLPLALRFLLATDPGALTRVLGIVYRTIAAHILKKARLTRGSGATDAVTLIQRLGSALNLNIHSNAKASAGIPIRMERDFIKQSDFDAGDPYVFPECLQTIYPINGRATPVAPPNVIPYEVLDIYNRPWWAMRVARGAADDRARR